MFPKKYWGRNEILEGSVGDGDFDSDVAVDFYATPEFLMVFEFVEILKEGAWVDIFHWFDFHHTFATQAMPTTV